MKEQFHEQLVLLEKELSRLKKVTDYIDGTKKTAQGVIDEVKEIQNNYSTYTEKIFDLYQTTIKQLKGEIKEGVIHFETTGTKIDQTTKKTAQVVISELKEVQNNYSTYTEEIFDLYETTIKQLKGEIKEGVIHFETTGTKIDQTTKKTAQVVISELKEVQNNYSTYTEKIFDLYKTTVEQLKKETELQIKEGVIHFETTGTKIDQTTKKTAQVVISELKEIQNNYSTYTEKIFDLYKTTVEQLKKETELQIKEGVIHFETTGTKIDQTNREKLVETKRLLENYRKTVEATDNLVKTLEEVDFPTRLDTIEEKISNALEEISERFNLQDKQNKMIKPLLFVLLGLIVTGGIGVILIWMKII